MKFYEGVTSDPENNHPEPVDKFLDDFYALSAVPAGTVESAY